MRIHCTRCQAEYDDAERATVCPHAEIYPAAILRRKDAAMALLGKRVRWAHLPDGAALRVQSVGWSGLVTVEGFAGEFAPHLFVVKEQE